LPLFVVLPILPDIVRKTSGVHPFGICIAALAMSALNHMPINDNPSAITNFLGMLINPATNL
jgi:hypothetical protein